MREERREREERDRKREEEGGDERERRGERDRRRRRRSAVRAAPAKNEDPSGEDGRENGSAGAARGYAKPQTSGADCEARTRDSGGGDVSSSRRAQAAADGGSTIATADSDGMSARAT
ncbi:hypothetical protein Scep_022852 [Stephania cephalantha]|uniref:Uncharacterized protein n=1 Tax=Stephania cephalantha TaxID=152367 RepID=A0AAP0FBJ7_9MAGN